MKKYVKPMANMNEYTLIERLANLDTWLAQEGSALGVENEIASYKTSYNMAS
ncbi:MAG: hypothetical protein IKB55_05975 [Clostridia bacterium]|nr:hypothetical protein [Clostridia bacterium]MBR2878725.1 hypothetical protein [Clostridia bacterium]